MNFLAETTTSRYTGPSTGATVRPSNKENAPPLPGPSRQATEKRPSSNINEAANKDPYTTLPGVTSSYIQVRIQLARFNGVYRIVRLPLTFTLANLHTYLQYIFGWSNDHLHEFQVHGNVEMYSGVYKQGTMKKWGVCPVPPVDFVNPDSPHYEFEMRLWVMDHRDSAIWKVVQKGSRKRATKEMNFFSDYDCSAVKEDQDVTLREIWNKNLKQNASAGECSNKQVGIAYEYDLGGESPLFILLQSLTPLHLTASWTVHITLENENAFCSVDPPSNLPVVVKAKGSVNYSSSHVDAFY